MARKRTVSDRELLGAAGAARAAAHAPYSGFRVGAALLGADGRIHVAANIETASYGLSLCAERAVVARAVAEGGSGFAAIALVSDGVDTSMCGPCRQFLMEFNPDMRVVTQNGTRVRTRRLRDLLPDPYLPERLKDGQRRSAPVVREE